MNWLLINTVMLILSCLMAGRAYSHRRFAWMGIWVGFAVMWAIWLAMRVFSLVVRWEVVVYQ
ncbi:Uncharacterised protein [Mycolicibacterium vanbaalenii]|uniref:Uncharacterized protein n=1 Tax=Mycolicibacterium vanbaalenii TaxID=110539 RepID=A0A5S9R5N6_MYCVN|nr:hypothetical protein [Mycolicibacterium vanbaalenii]CAA0129270.1 Uncharacterised protein [Mycolicibacterium vanbaalenii]